MSTARWRLTLFSIGVSALACELIEPQVVVRNDLESPVQIAEVSFLGCYWPSILSSGESTAPCNVQPGEGRVHFERFDVQRFVVQALDAADEDQGALLPSEDRLGWRLPTPLWFGYQTTALFSAGYGDFLILSVSDGGIEQDFERPGPYGH